MISTNYVYARCENYLKKFYWKDKRLLWTHGYFCSTIGEVSEQTVKHYIENQGWIHMRNWRFRIILQQLIINVACYGLRTDFKSKLFPGSKRLFELADTIEEIKSTCECGNKTIINARVDKDGNVLKNGPQTLVGGDDRYISICRKCWKRSI